MAALAASFPQLRISIMQLDSQFAPGNFSQTGTYPLDAPNKNMFPPVCLKTHWDPTAMSKFTFPEQHVALPLSFRPNTRICMQYVTSGDVTPVPAPPADLVFPSGGQFYPPTRYMSAIDKESLLRRLDRPLGTPDSKEYQPPTDSDMYTYKNISVPRSSPNGHMIAEMEMPRALLRDNQGAYECRHAADRVAMAAASGSLFSYPTKLSKYGIRGGGSPSNQHLA
jgi:hypothetical protein